MKRVLMSTVLLTLAISVSAAPATVQEKRIKRGEYLTIIAGCHDCHSPKTPQFAPDMTRPLSGRPATTSAPPQPAQMGLINASPDLTAWYGPWGVSYASNLTPDPETGIGKRYNEASFIKTIRTGKKPEGEMLLPPMPWPNFARMTDEDLRAVYAYLQTLKPVKNFVRTAAAPPKTAASATKSSR